ncbi:SDR family oxidoreductase [Halobacterium sp. CBA1126]|uniref:SDR family oxidoreductase n=1 Tax=Halobacterium sp. CBA1126 TaxID=2668074 RepID=UPI0012FBE31E|nr:SDR family oxidoreductase [Halobacterium sp. CBA1126]MUV60462.1 SDR family NAD(P)-dependent oxidoreductase [Halobacterium sp. CBA1126]
MEKVALVTGCSSGIGAATARSLLDEEWTVVATARDTDDLAALAEAGCETAELDVTKPAQCRNVVDDVVDEHGRLDCLVNNAGYAQLGPLEDVPTRELHRQFDVNVYGPHRLIRAALPHMREREDGTIVNVSSVAGRVATPGMGAYNGSKFALEGMSDALRAEVEPYDVDVALVEPGPVDTSFQDRAEEEIQGLDRSGAYESLYSFFEDASAVNGVGAVPPEAVAEVVTEAAVSPDPAARYPVGTAGRLGVLSRFLPDGVRDGLYRVAGSLSSKNPFGD